ncbi:MAG TPA: prolipoprotein diacylglyceryl transferase [Beijerinckiaceae bacterium]|nr:prolipoprotein diacylglyceryl transferase [Beijerinckiaceae bacterium]
MLAIPFPMIDPIAVSIGPLVIRWYALAYIGGLLVGWWYARRLVRQGALWGTVTRPSEVALDDLIVYMALGVVIGGRLGEVVFYNLPYYLAHPAEILQVWRGGMSFHGGLIGAAVAAVLFARKAGVLTLTVFDLCSTVVPVGLLLGRVANFINAELWGRISDVPWAVIFPNAGPEPRHPSQLYQAFLEGAVLLVVLGLAAQRLGFAKPGRLAGIFGMGYGIARLIGEFFREPDDHIGFLFGGWLTMGMALSVPVFAVGLWLYRRAR